ncbi:hypothetical protein [Bacillus sp. RC51]|uniref:hypothetical protein n=1 Tax=Bacillus TaxID=1386 RepID=UPI0038329895
MNKVGRKVKLTETQVKEIIYLYKTEKNVSGQIKYSDIHCFSNYLVEQGRLGTTTSESFWRKQGRLGRELVDEANTLFTHRLSSSNDTKKAIPNIVDLIDKKHTNKEDLINSLLPLEKLLINGQKKENELKQKNEDYKKQLSIQKHEYNKLQKKQDQFQLLLFELFHYILMESTNKTKETAIKAMEELFTNPTNFFQEFKKISLINNSSENVVSIDNHKTEQKLSNRFRDKFN